MNLSAKQEANEALDILYQISCTLGTSLSKETLSILAGLCEAGVNPEALAVVVRELRREAQAIEAAESVAGALLHAS